MLESVPVEQKDEFDVLLDKLERDVSALDLTKIEQLIVAADIIATQPPTSINQRKSQRVTMRSLEDALVDLDTIDTEIAPVILMRNLLSAHMMTQLCRKVFSPACIPIRERNRRRMSQLDNTKKHLDAIQQHSPKLREQIYHLILRDITYAVVALASGCVIDNHPTNQLAYQSRNQPIIQSNNQQIIQQGPKPSQAVKSIIDGCINFTALFSYDVPVEGTLVHLQLEQSKSELSKLQTRIDREIETRENNDQDERPRLLLLKHQVTIVMTYIDKVNQKVNRNAVYTLIHCPVPQGTV